MRLGTLDLGTHPVLLAPMEDITGPAFRLICREAGAAMVYSEFISSEGLIRNAMKSTVKLRFSEAERPMALQLFGADEKVMVEAARMAMEEQPDVIDINWGCPVRKVVSKDAGAAMLKDVPRMIRITSAVVRVVNRPVTVKTRLGWDEKSKNIVEVAERLQNTGISAITIHARTRQQLYGGKADWTLIGEVMNNPRMNIPVIGNGDIDNPVQAREAFDRFGVAGIMIGRAATGRPWLFKQIRHLLDKGETLPEPDMDTRTSLCRRQLLESLKWKNEKTAVLEMRKHYSGYFKGLPFFRDFKLKLMQAATKEEVLSLFDLIREHYA
ncbi:MAG: tRNA dihydrouridine synthase DusB [Bacteroidales bacterium]|nr:tRNA dihydrouridine synthase DusB [Bacteroidales bacterium]